MFHEKLNVTIILNLKNFTQLFYKKDLPLKSAISRYEKNRNKWNLILKKHREWVMIVFQRIVQNII